MAATIMASARDQSGSGEPIRGPDRGSQDERGMLGLAFLERGSGPDNRSRSLTRQSENQSLDLPHLTMSDNPVV